VLEPLDAVGSVSVNPIKKDLAEWEDQSGFISVVLPALVDLLQEFKAVVLFRSDRAHPTSIISTPNYS